MRAGSIVLIIVLLIAVAAPVSAADDERYGYLTISDISIRLDNGTANIQVNYTVDEGTRFIFFLFGKQDLKKKLLKILNYDDAKMKNIDLSSAEFTVNDASISYGDGIYWYPAHAFNVVIPNLTIRSPQVTQNFSMVKEFPAGIGYFAQSPVEDPVSPESDIR